MNLITSPKRINGPLVPYNYNGRPIHAVHVPGDAPWNYWFLRSDVDIEFGPYKFDPDLDLGTFAAVLFTGEALVCAPGLLMCAGRSIDLKKDRWPFFKCVQEIEDGAGQVFVREMQEGVESQGDVPLMNSREIAEKTKVTHKNVMELLRTHQIEIEKQCGAITFETALLAQGRNRGGGKPQKWAMLNEEQVTVLLTLMRNSPEIVPAKAAIGARYVQMRRALQKGVTIGDVPPAALALPSTTASLLSWTLENVPSALQVVFMRRAVELGKQGGLIVREGKRDGRGHIFPVQDLRSILANMSREDVKRFDSLTDSLAQVVGELPELPNWLAVSTVISRLRGLGRMSASVGLPMSSTPASLRSSFGKKLKKWRREIGKGVDTKGRSFCLEYHPHGRARGYKVNPVC